MYYFYAAESRSLTITTFAKDRIQRRSNSSNSPSDEYIQTKEKVYYTQAPENVVIKVIGLVSDCLDIIMCLNVWGQN